MISSETLSAAVTIVDPTRPVCVPRSMVLRVLDGDDRVSSTARRRVIAVARKGKRVEPPTEGVSRLRLELYDEFDSPRLPTYATHPTDGTVLDNCTDSRAPVRSGKPKFSPILSAIVGAGHADGWRPAGLSLSRRRGLGVTADSRIALDKPIMTHV